MLWICMLQSAVATQELFWVWAFDPGFRYNDGSTFTTIVMNWWLMWFLTINFDVQQCPAWNSGLKIVDSELMADKIVGCNSTPRNFNSKGI